MSGLREVRVKLELDVRVWGLDSSGKPFSYDCKTVEISGCGACLTGVTNVQVDEVIGLQYKDQKSRFRVVWVGAAGSEQTNQVGVENLDPKKCIWVAVLENGPARREIAKGTVAESPAGKTWPGTDRRRYARYPCSGTIRVKVQDVQVSMVLRLTDLSLGGCYAETMSPLPLGTPVSLQCNIDGSEFASEGVVRTCHPAMGNGIGFTAIQPGAWKTLAHIVRRISGGKVSEAEQNADITIAEPLEVLLGMLEKRGILSRQEFMEELRQTWSTVEARHT